MFKLFIYLGIFILITGCAQQQKKESDHDDTKAEEAPVTTTGEEVGNDLVISDPLPENFRHPKDNAPMILIPGGPFIYGMNKPERDSILKLLGTPLLDIFEYEFPEKVVSIPSFYIDKFEVTNKQYQQFMEETGHRPPKYFRNKLYMAPNQPVVGLGWKDAMAYTRWAKKRLPTEEEWEKAARGTDGRVWPWGNKPDGKNYIGRQSGKMTPIQVGMYPNGASPYGVMDMAGNVYEMTTGTWGINSKAMRGGSYLNAGAYTRTTFRWATNEENTGAEYLGFRCVVDTAYVLKERD